MAGIYIHIPFCRQACTYCNFHFSTSLKNKDELLEAVRKEIQYRDDFISDTENIHTIYFGGGTPSLLSKNDIDGIMEVLQKRFTIHTDAEITLEANPDDISSKNLSDWKDAGINRLSIGIQSFIDEELQWMNRAHNASQSLTCIDEILNAGWDNISADLIFGSPLLSDEQLEKNISILTGKGIPHISCYALTVEEKTALHHQVKTKKSPPVKSEKQAEQFLLTLHKLIASGYEHYEISNYALPGKRSRHNSSYWQGARYWGFGPSAHSFDGKNSRRWNVSNNQAYMNSWNINKPCYETELLSTAQQLNEYIMTSLRTIEGLSLEYVQRKFGNDAVNSITKKTIAFDNKGLLVLNNKFITLTSEGKLLADGISADLFFD